MSHWHSLKRSVLSGHSLALMAHLGEAIMLQQLLLACRISHADLHERPDGRRCACADGAPV